MKRKRLLYGALFTGLAVGVGYALTAEAPARATASSPPPIPEVPVAEVLVRRLAPEVELTGRLSAVEHVALRARVSGFVEAVAFTEGARVRKGQLLFQLDARPFRAAVERARAEVVRAEEREAFAKLALTRGERLAPDGVISASAHDALSAEVAQARAATAAARASLRAAELELEHTRVVSPIEGRAGRAHVTAGNLVSGGTDGATLLTTIVSIDPIFVELDVDEPTYLRLGAQAEAGGESPAIAVGLADEDGFPHAAAFDFIGNALDPSSGTAPVRARLANPDGRFAPGLFVRARLATGRPRDMVLIQERAVSTDQAGRYVLVVNAEGAVEQRHIMVGATSAGLRIVESGLSAGERVVMGGWVRPGMKVQPRRVEMTPASSPLAVGRTR